MNLYKFTIISQRDVQALNDTTEDILLNLDQIVSVKPINIVVETEVINGYWIRMTNGKKYRAIKIPKAISSILLEHE